MEGNFGKIKIRYGMWIKKKWVKCIFEEIERYVILYIFRII